MIGDSKAPIIIYDENLAGLIPDYKGETILTRSIAAMQGDEKVLLPVIKHEDLFILLYTSGSTELPKGCMLTHRNIADFCLRCNHRYQVTQNDRACAYASFGFDACMMDFYPYLTTGGSVYYCLRI